LLKNNKTTDGIAFDLIPEKFNYMKSTLFIVFAGITILFISCSGKNEKKEAAKEYLKNQTINYTEPEPTATPVEEKATGDNVVAITDKTFEKSIAKGVSIVDFWATWCRPCRVQAPILDELAIQYKGKIKFYKLDVDENYVTPNRFKVANIPTLIIFKDGVQVEKLIGLQEKAALENVLTKYM